MANNAVSGIYLGGIKDLAKAIDRLTERQKACLRLVGNGFTSKEIGRQLDLSPSTIDNHIRAALDTLHIDSRAEAARLLLAGETSQPLPSQPPQLAQSVFNDPSIEPAGQWHRIRRSLLPPLGGTLHDLSNEERFFAILRVAFAGFSSLMLLTLGIVILLWLLR